MNETVKAAALNHIAPQVLWAREGQTSYRSEFGLIHTRFKTSSPFSFNIYGLSLFTAG